MAEKIEVKQECFEQERPSGAAQLNVMESNFSSAESVSQFEGNLTPSNASEVMQSEPISSDTWYFTHLVFYTSYKSLKSTFSSSAAFVEPSSSVKETETWRTALFSDHLSKEEEDCQFIGEEGAVALNHKAATGEFGVLF